MKQLALVDGAEAWLMAVALVTACAVEPDAGTSEPLPDQPAAGADAAAPFDVDAGPGSTPDAGSGLISDAGNGADALVDAATDADPFIDAAAAVDAGTVPDPVVDAGTVPDPVVDAGTGPDPVVDSGTVPDPVVDAGTPTEPAGLTLYYIRHAEVVGNTLDPADITWESMEEFTALGQRQVDDLTAFLLQMEVVPDVVLTSPTWRTQKTMEPYLVATGLTGVIWMELDECPDAEPTGGPLPAEPTYFEYFEASVVASNVVFRDPGATSYWDNQTYEDGLFMAMTARDELLRLYSQSGLTIFVAGHAVAGNILLGLLRGIDMTGGIDYMSGDMLWMQNTGIQVVVQDPATGLFSLEASNLNDPASD